MFSLIFFILKISDVIFISWWWIILFIIADLQVRQIYRNIFNSIEFLEDRISSLEEKFGENVFELDRDDKDNIF